MLFFGSGSTSAAGAGVCDVDLDGSDLEGDFTVIVVAAVIFGVVFSNFAAGLVGADTLSILHMIFLDFLLMNFSMGWQFVAAVDAAGLDGAKLAGDAFTC